MTRTPTGLRRAVAGALLVLPLLMLELVAPSRAGAAQDEDAAALLDRAAATMAALDAFHFSLTTPRGQTLFMENLELAGIEGDVQRPDRFRATATAKAAIIELDVKIVGIGTRLWVTDPTAQEEQYIEFDAAQTGGAEGGSPIDLLNPDRVLLEAVELIEEPVVAGEDEVDGADTTRIDGTFDLGRLQALGTPVPGLVTNQALPVSLWIDDQGRVRRLELEGPLTAVEGPDVVRRLDLSAFDEPVDIQAPA